MFISKPNTAEMITEAVKCYLAGIDHGPEMLAKQTQVRLITTTNKVVQELNQRIQAELLADRSVMAGT